MNVISYDDIPWPVHERAHVTGTRTHKSVKQEKAANPFAALHGWRSPRVNAVAWWNTNSLAYVNAHSAFGKAELDPAAIERVGEAIKNDRLILLPSASRNQDSVALSSEWVESVLTELGYDLQQNGDHHFLSAECNWLVSAMRAYGYEPIFGCFVKADVKTLNEKISKVAKALKISEPKQLIKKLFAEASSKKNKVAATNVWKYVIFGQKFDAVFLTKEKQELFSLCSHSLSKDDRRFIEKASKLDVDCDASYKCWLTTILTYKDLQTVSEYAYNWYPYTVEFRDFVSKVEAIDGRLNEAWPLVLKVLSGRYASFFSAIRRIDSYCTQEEFEAVIEMVKAVSAFRKKNN